MAGWLSPRSRLPEEKVVLVQTSLDHSHFGIQLDPFIFPIVNWTLWKISRLTSYQTYEHSLF